VSALNLIPDLEILCAQTGIFLANLVVVKTLIINPYLSLQEKRRAHTSDSQDQAQKTLASCVQQSAAIEAQIAATIAEVSTQGEKVKAQALTEQQRLIVAVRQQVDVDLEAMRREIAEQLAEQRSKVPAVAEQLSKQFYQTLLA
jgi:F0F1-type ATP synthase membrane subunit b/b'